MLIKGNTHTDSRGSISFVNDFDMSQIVRMYVISPQPNVVRAWQGHKKETKWFLVTKGKILVRTRSIEGSPKLTEQILKSDIPQVLQINPGFFNGFESLEKGSILTVFSDFTLEESKQDDYRATLEEIPWIKH